MLIEADPEGGVLAARWHHSLGVTHDPGLLSLAATRDGSALERVRQHGQPIGDGLELVAGPPGGAQAEACLRELGGGAAEALRDAPVVCIVDCGRLHPASSALPLARAAERVLLVTRPRLDEVVGLAPAAERLLAAGLTPTLVCIGTAPFAPAEVAEHVGLPLRAVIADDPVALATLSRRGRRAPGGAQPAAEVGHRAGGDADAGHRRSRSRSGRGGNHDGPCPVSSDLTDRVVADVTDALSSWSHREEAAGAPSGRRRSRPSGSGSS